jgi:hypothetical protein
MLSLFGLIGELLYKKSIGGLFHLTFGDGLALAHDIQEDVHGLVTMTVYELVFFPEFGVTVHECAENEVQQEILYDGVLFLPVTVKYIAPAAHQIG